MDRRNILRAIGAASIGMGSVKSVSADTATDDTDEISAATLTGRNRQNVISDAFSDTVFQDIVTHVESQGWRIVQRQMEARRVSYELSRGHYDFIVVEAERTASSQQNVASEEMILIWVGNDTIGLDLPQHTVAHHVRKTPPSKISNIQQSKGLLGWDEVTVIKAEGRTITEHERDFHEEGTKKTGKTDNVGPNPDPGGGGSGGCCTIDIEIGADAKWGCTALAILSAGISGWTCGACFLDPTRATCALCVIGAAASGISTAHCFSSTVTVQDDVERSWIYDNDLMCSDFETSNDNTLIVSESFFSDELPTC